MQAFCYDRAKVAMSGWGCRHQYEDQCLRMRKECKPGMPGCVLRGKVRFIHEVERERAESVNGKRAEDSKRTLKTKRPDRKG